MGEIERETRRASEFFCLFFVGGEEGKKGQKEKTSLHLFSFPLFYSDSPNLVTTVRKDDGDRGEDLQVAESELDLGGERLGWCCFLSFFPEREKS